MARASKLPSTARRLRLASPPEGDVTLEELAAALDFDLDQVRAEAAAGKSRAQLATS